MNNKPVVGGGGGGGGKPDRLVEGRIGLPGDVGRTTAAATGTVAIALHTAIDE